MAELSKLSDDQELRRIQILVAETEILVAETKLKLKESDLWQKEWDYRNQGSVRALMRNLIIVGAILTTFATTGATIVSYINSYFQQKAEQVERTLSLSQRLKNLESKPNWTVLRMRLL